jgi:hypothetical protein
LAEKIDRYSQNTVGVQKTNVFGMIKHFWLYLPIYAAYQNNFALKNYPQVGYYKSANLFFQNLHICKMKMQIYAKNH